MTNDETKVATARSIGANLRNIRELRKKIAERDVHAGVSLRSRNTKVAGSAFFPNVH
jgi:hypothetical protein